jgi:tRNA pseudouridine(38-40) synthase
LHDANSEYIDEVQRTDWINKLLLGSIEGGDGSLFETAHMIVDHFLSSYGDQSTYPLRRIHDINVSDSTADLFQPVFGPYNNDCIENASVFGGGRKRKRSNLKLTVAYRGLDFCGWEDQRHHLYRKESYDAFDDSKQNQICILPSVQGTLVDVLDPIFGRRSTNGIDSKQKTRPIEIKVAGRTDAGVSAIAQICRIRTWRTDLPNNHNFDEIESYIQAIVNDHAKSLELGLRITSVEKVSDDFHPTFQATCRAYAYFIDLQNDNSISTQTKLSASVVPTIDRMLRYLEGQSLDYFAFSYGKVKTQTTLCRLLRAQASIVEWNCDDGSSSVKRQAICVELVGDRFLRRMVRILVATALREACLGVASDDALFNILKTKDRANASCGLIFVGAGYKC